MSAAASFALNFLAGGGSDPYVRSGFSISEPSHRWSEGYVSELALPPLAPSPRFALTLDAWALNLWGARQTLDVELNGAILAETLVFPPEGLCVIGVDGALVSAERENLLVFRQPHAIVPGEHDAQNGDPRRLAIAWRRLEIAPAAVLELLTPDDGANVSHEHLARQFQSLGQNCEFGIFQRRCGVEPPGLLRFANTSPEALKLGLETRFHDIDRLSALSFVADPGGEMFGVHAVYHLGYHTFRKAAEVEMAAFHASESRRLGILARFLIEQIEHDEKIFVRRGGVETDPQALALHGLLTALHPDARLLVMREAPEPALAGRVARLAPNLYVGWLERFAAFERVHSTLPFEDWLKICATVWRDPRARRDA